MAYLEKLSIQGLRSFGPNDTDRGLMNFVSSFATNKRDQNGDAVSSKLTSVMIILSIYHFVFRSQRKRFGLWPSFWAPMAVARPRSSNVCVTSRPAMFLRDPTWGGHLYTTQKWPGKTWFEDVSNSASSMFWISSYVWIEKYFKLLLGPLMESSIWSAEALKQLKNKRRFLSNLWRELSAKRCPTDPWKL